MKIIVKFESQNSADSIESIVPKDEFEIEEFLDYMKVIANQKMLSETKDKDPSFVID